jgi:hypothetical protein
VIGFRRALEAEALGGFDQTVAQSKRGLHMSTITPTSQEVPSALSDIASGYMKTQALYVAAKLGVADHLTEKPQSSEALARAIDVHPGALYKLLRFLESLGLFSEPEPGIFALTTLGAHLRNDAPSGFHTQILMNAELHWHLWGELMYTITTGQAADQRVYGMPIFDYLQQHPEKAALFNEEMTRFIATMAPAVVAAYDFSSFGTIVDVGGGHGTLLATVLQANPQAHGVLFDLPITVEGARQHMATLGLSERCTCVGGDFFASVPAGDCIILSAVISDWDDEQSVRILTNCRQAIAPEGRLLLLERLLIPEEPAPPTAFLDLAMLISGGGTGRSQGEFRNLLAGAGFDLMRVVPTGTQRSIFEARLV